MASMAGRASSGGMAPRASDSRGLRRATRLAWCGCSFPMNARLPLAAALAWPVWPRRAAEGELLPFELGVPAPLGALAPPAPPADGAAPAGLALDAAARARRRAPSSVPPAQWSMTRLTPRWSSKASSSLHTFSWSPASRMARASAMTISRMAGSRSAARLYCFTATTRGSLRAPRAVQTTAVDGLLLPHMSNGAERDAAASPNSGRRAAGRVAVVVTPAANTRAKDPVPRSCRNL
mmetsp:Transcript_18664/g.70902  ORF Transcript_18664/g.70902 Transcript_18664/m.70902 type:complete len:236 (-) Transcript_18664:119-826(-)